MFFSLSTDLFDWQKRQTASPPIEPWVPQPREHSQWPPDYKGVYVWRMNTLRILQDDPVKLKSAWAYYSKRPGEFIMHWMDTYNPRKKENKWMPFIFFKRQAEFVDFLHELRTDGENGLCEKCRDAGATWLACGYSIWSWIFIRSDSIGWGSRKKELVDKKGDPSSIFEKMRLILRRLPGIWLPEHYSEKTDATYMKIINRQNGSVITGEIGDNIGRGGRSAMYFKDESAHYDRPELVEAALGDNTDVQVDISSVNGLGNVFHRRREAGVEWSPGAEIEPGFTRVFVIDWRHHPEKTQEWYDVRKARFEREGMQHIFAQEVDRNYAAAISNTIINAEWIDAAVDAHLKVPYLRRPPNEIPDKWIAGLDVADEGGDRNALTLRQWIIWRDVKEWGSRDVGETTRHAVDGCQAYQNIDLQYDCIGVGAGVKSEYNRMRNDDDLKDKIKGLSMTPWHAGGAVIDPGEHVIPEDPDSPLNKDMFGNMKAQAWWSVRTRFYKTWRAVTYGDVYDPEELISLCGKMQLLFKLKKQLAQPTRGLSSGLRTIIEKRPEGMTSPDLADSGIMAFFPIPKDDGTVVVGEYG